MTGMQMVDNVVKRTGREDSAAATAAAAAAAVAATLER